MQERDVMRLTIIMRRLTSAGAAITDVLIMKISIGMSSTTLRTPWMTQTMMI